MPRHLSEAARPSADSLPATNGEPASRARCLLLILPIFLSIPRSQALAAFRASADFESGSAQVLALDPETQTVRITPAGDPTRGMPNWWFIRLDDVDPLKPLTLEVVPKKATLPTDVPGRTSQLTSTWS